MKNTTKQARSIVGDSPAGRPENDFYPTPPPVTRALLRVVPFVPPLTILEPACGDGAMSEVLKSTGLEVISSDLDDHGYGDIGVDFLDSTRTTSGPLAIVTNPPFKLAYEFIDHAINNFKADHLCLLMKLVALEGISRSKLMHDTKLSRVYVFRNRIKLTRNGDDYKNGGMMAFAWFVWNRGWTGAPEIGWISTKD